ncbi:hypothetical protein SAMN05443637_10380 [Pseudonocardia thermophila]|uniref:Acyl dehydratase n=1 Tax=Pseudonocardia thermophila TaxID=1848 RepID=A0A1M6Q473_PSETH|nr:hypothetical protein [Pseudonocardia thermophila]SHK14961.1 hypothetical protein SAMN05443637_10380 [Pseudonocardia thermophila]
MHRQGPLTERTGEHFEDIPFDALTPGRTFRAELHLTEDLVREYGRLCGTADEPRTTVSPAVYCTFLPTFRALNGRLEQGTVHVEQRLEVRRAVPVGTVLEAETTVRSRQGTRRQVVLETVFTDDAGIVCTSTSTYLWGFARP